MRNKVLKVILILMLFIIIGLMAAFVYSIFYFEKLEEQISERDKTIRELSFRSELVEEYFDYGTLPDDSTKMYYTLKESKIPQRIVKEKVYEYFEKEIEKEKIIDRTPSILSRDSNISVEELIRRYNAILDSNYYNKREIQQLTTTLDLIKKAYGITYDISIESNRTITTLRNTEKVDSALMILPYYRDRLVKDTDGAWLIKTRNKWLGL